MKQKSMKDNKLYNLVWYMFGLLSYGFTSLLYMIIITRILGVESAGMFSFAFAVAATFYVVGVYFGSAFQVTDISNKYSDTDYLHNRFTTCLIMLLLTLIFCIFNKYGFDKILLIMFLTVYRGVDAVLDSVHAVTQKRDKIYKIGILTFFRTMALIIIFAIIAYISRSLIVSVIGILIVDIMFAYFGDYKVAKPKIVKSQFSRKKNLKLLVDGFLVFLFSFLAIYILNSPKYAIDTILDNTNQGIFGIVFMPSSFMSMFCLYLVHPFLNNFADFVKEKKFKALALFTIKLAFAIIGLGLLITLVGYLLGIPVLNLLYNLDLGAYKIDLVIILLGTILLSLYTLFSNVLVAMRKNVFQVVALSITAVFGYFICKSFIANQGLDGACYSYFLIMSFQLVIYIGGLVFYLIKENKKSLMKK